MIVQLQYNDNKVLGEILNQPINQSINRLMNQSINKSIKKKSANLPSLLIPQSFHSIDMSSPLASSYQTVHPQWGLTYTSTVSSPVSQQENPHTVWYHQGPQ